MSEPNLPDDFDAEAYLALNHDVRADGWDAAEHYLKHGHREKRLYRPELPIRFANLTGAFEFDGLRTEHNHDFMNDPAFLSAYHRGIRAAGADYKFYWRAHIALWAARSAARVPGDFIECGVNFGVVSSMIMSDLNWDSTGRMFWLLDTFSGIDPRYVADSERKSDIIARNDRWIASGLYTTNLDAVRANFSEWQNKTFVVGAVPETLPQVKTDSIAFIHIDMNCSPPEVAAIDAFWPHMTLGGVVLLDDYAYHGFQPQKEGMDAWAADHGVPIASLPTGQGLMIKA